ncbi:serine/threonine protein kinase, partial [Myxococcota bacterium]|nr:serine/threonine protein kinase [Myxococcota bacterium]
MERFGPYQLLKQLGEGGMGAAYLARPVDRRSGIPPLVVVKRMMPELGQRAESVLRFRHEAELATHIDSPHVAAVYDAGQVGDTLFIAMEYVRGWPLSRVMRSFDERGLSMSLPSAVDVVADALAGLAALHEARDATGQHLAAVHRDVSPKNLMIGEDGRTRLIDLGIGKSTRQAWKTRTGAIVGTPGYLAPEQAGGNGPIDHRADLFAIGVVLWELLSGDAYIARDSVVKMLVATVMSSYRPLAPMRTDVPRALDALLARVLSIDPARRPGSA